MRQREPGVGTPPPPVTSRNSPRLGGGGQVLARQQARSKVWRHKTDSIGISTRTNDRDRCRRVHSLRKRDRETSDYIASLFEVSWNDYRKYRLIVKYKRELLRVKYTCWAWYIDHAALGGLPEPGTACAMQWEPLHFTQAPFNNEPDTEKCHDNPGSITLVPLPNALSEMSFGKG